MVSDFMKESLSSCLGPVENAFCLPPLAYTSSEALNFERNSIFDKGWVPIGRADRLLGIGDYVALDIIDRPVILIRNNENELNALANSCRHRGAKLLEGTGTIKGIRCPFHSWLYRTDGTLAAAPRMERSISFQDCSNDLIRYDLVERLGFLFISFQEKPIDIDDWLGNFALLHESWPLSEMITTRTWTREFPFNWKCFLDVFNEYYHLPFVHRDSIDAVYHSPREGDIVTGNFATQFGETDGTGGLLESQQNFAFGNMPGLKDDALVGARYTWMFPTMTFACSNDALWVYEARPISEHTCVVTQSTCFHPDTIAKQNFTEVAAVYYDRMDTALEEDLVALQNQFAGLSSPEARQGPFSPNLEHNVAAFANWYSEKILKSS